VVERENQTMNFYLCSTDKGQRLAGTQADAKALDPRFKSHEVPTDKPGLMGYINSLFSALANVASAAAPAQPVEEAAPVAAPAPAPPPKATEPMRPGDCPMCHRSPAGAALLAKGASADEVGDMIMQMSGFQLDKIEAALTDRRAEVAREKAAASPPPRQRIRPAAKETAQ
jgi:hypothetical protein